MKPLFLTLILVSSMCLSSTAQTYQIQWQYDLPVATTAVLGGAVAFALQQNHMAITPQELQHLDPNRIPKFERFVTKNWSPTAQKQSDILLGAAVVMPALFLLDKKLDKGPVAMVVFETYMLNAALTGLTKELVGRKRPFVYHPDVPLHRKLAADSQRSFYSGHTSTVAALSFMSAKIYQDYHPNSRFVPYIWATAALIPALTGYLRVRGGKHFVSDVVVGYLAGASVGLLVPLSHKHN